MKIAEAVKSGQEQAVAAWIDYLNQVRFADLLEALNAQDSNLQNALGALKWATDNIQNNLIELNRGGDKGLHGFIAEVAEVGIGNAKQAIQGNGLIYGWLDDNGPSDIRIDEILFQMKFVEGGGSFSLNAILEHLEKYPDYLKNGGKYIIPKDFYEKVEMLLRMDIKEASRLSVNADGMSFRQWQKVNELFEQNDVSIDDIQPARIEYNEAHKERIQEVLDREESSLREEDESSRRAAYEDSKPTLGQAAQATAVSAAVEGATTFVMEVARKLREGKSLRDFSEEDWSQIAEKTGAGTLKGGVRGASIYALTNFTATPGAVASALCTASFSVAEQAHRFRSGEIDEVEFIRESEIVCLDAAVSALSSAIGQAIIPVPVIGAVIGNTVGTVIYQTAKDGLSSYEQKIVEQYKEEQKKLDERLSKEYQALMVELRQDMSIYCHLLDRAFHPDPLVAINGSAELALSLGVLQGEVLDSIEKIDSYFLD